MDTNKDIKHTAYKMIVEKHINELPIDSSVFFNSYNILTYADLIVLFRRSGVDLDPHKLIEIYGDGMAIYNDCYNKYAIFYNAHCKLNTINWIVAHELGHIVRKHLDSDNPIITMKTQSLQQEHECEQFAGFLLCPDTVLSAGHILNKDDISETCLIPTSKAALKERVLNMNRFALLIEDTVDPVSKQMLYNFKAFIKSRRRTNFNEEISEELCYFAE